MRSIMEQLCEGLERNYYSDHGNVTKKKVFTLNFPRYCMGIFPFIKVKCLKTSERIFEVSTYGFSCIGLGSEY